MYYIIEFKIEVTIKTQPIYLSGTSVQRDRQCWYFTNSLDHALTFDNPEKAEEWMSTLPMKDTLVITEKQNVVRYI